MENFNKIENTAVTAIIPCYNDGAYVLKALDSLLNQTMLPEKIIIIDDGSDNETVNVLKSVKNKIVEIIFQNNQGVCAARNNGIEKATTSYILTLDADDYVENSFIEKAFLELDNNLNIAAVGSYVKTLTNDKIDTKILKPLGGRLKDFLWKNNATSCCLFRKKCWKEVGGYDENMLKGYEDWEFWVAILSRGWELKIIPEPLFIYRKKNISRDKTASYFHDYELRTYILQKHKESFKKYFEFYCSELLRLNMQLRSEKLKIKNSYEYKIGEAILKPIKKLKNLLSH